MLESNIRLVWSPESEADLLHIWAEGALRFSKEIADSHLRNIQSTASRLTEQPLLGREREELQPGIRSLVIYPTVLFYRVSGDAVEVVRVLDGRRDLPTIFLADK